jgi:NitT/TauT family transport system ATP-binding protein
MMPAVSLIKLSLGYGDSPVLRDFSLDFAAGEFTCVLGPSGCGKSTLLQAIGGFRQPQSGQVRTSGKLAVVVQKHNLFPWKTALENVAIGLRSAGMGATAAAQEGRESLQQVGLMEKAKSYPGELSLGQQQRVGIARAFSLKAPVLLMDEPFGSLDAQTRLRMQQLLLGIWAKDKPTVIFVTHDIDEALLLGDRVLVLSGAPAEIRADLRVRAARPRLFESLATPELAGLRKEIFSLL